MGKFIVITEPIHLINGTQDIVHLLNPITDNSTMCGLDLEGYQYENKERAVVTCECCTEIIQQCKGVRTKDTIWNNLENYYNKPAKQYTDD